MSIPQSARRFVRFFFLNAAMFTSQEELLTLCQLRAEARGSVKLALMEALELVEQAWTKGRELVELEELEAQVVVELE